MSSNETRFQVKNEGIPRRVAPALLAVLFALLVTAVPQLSLTADEPVYMAAGHAFMRSGDLRLATSAQHPPLMQELVAFPLLLQAGPEPWSLAGWDLAEMARYAPAFVNWYGDRVETVTFLARMPVVGITLLWAAFVFRWAADWFGGWGGVVALTLFVFDPNVLAHGTLATNDVGVSAFGFISLFAVMRLLHRRQKPADRFSLSSGSRRYLLLAGVALGASVSSKSSGFLVALVLTALLPLDALVSGNGRFRQVLHGLFRSAVMLTLGAFVLWASYGFESRALAVGGPSVPMATQWEVWREMGNHLAQGHTSYMMGQIGNTGWLTYYPLAFVIKTPLLTLALSALGCIAAVITGPRGWKMQLPMWLFVVSYSAATLISRVNTGYRFLLPILPFVFILAAGPFRTGAPWFRSVALRWASWTGLVVLGGVISLSMHPHYLTFFNLLAGGPAQGHRYLVDSNLDWGQSFKALQRFQDQEGIEQVWLSRYTYADPALYGVRYVPIPPSPGAPAVFESRFNPAPGFYAIGATTLQGLLLADPDMYSWFRNRPPLGRLGNAIFVYQVEQDRTEASWLAQCSVPAPPLTPELAAEGFGRADLRLVYFDCGQSWVYPAVGEASGWYALHHKAASARDSFIDAHLNATRVSYEQRSDRAAPAFVLFEQLISAARDVCERSQLGSQMVDRSSLDGPLDFVGYVVPDQPARAGETVEIETCWRVTAVPQRPLSIMLHLIGPDSTPVVVGDGLGVPIEGWRKGDVIAQRHVLKVPVDAPSGEYSLYTGGYWLDNLQRWAVLGPDGPAGDQLALSPLPVAASER